MKGLLFFFLFCLVAWSSPNKRTVLNGTAATVGDTILTVQDAHLYRALQRFREGTDKILEREDQDALKRTVQKMVFEEMVFQEMKSLEVEMGDKSNSEKIVQNRKKSKSGAAAWKQMQEQFSLTENALLQRLQRVIAVEQFLQKKVDTLTPIITDAEIERYYKSNEARFRGSSLEQMKPNISLLLRKQSAQKGLEEWVKFLKDKYRVQNQLDS
jgi:hypothetical protein